LKKERRKTDIKREGTRKVGKGGARDDHLVLP
jgi:hypothetical protein